jgi:predicted dehydrogenase
MGPQFPTRVSAAGGIYVQKDREVPDTYSTAIEYPTFTVNLTGSMANSASQRMLVPAIYGQKGSILIEDKGVRLVPEPVYSRQEPKSEKVVPVEPKELHRAHMENLFECMRTRKQPLLHPELGWQIMTAIRLGVDSYRQGKLMLFDTAERRVIDRALRR